MAPKGEDGILHDVFVCAPCRKLLQKPETALPLLRGRVTIENRGRPNAKREIDRFMEVVSSWKHRN